MRPILSNITFVVSLLAYSHAHASGFAIIEQSASGMGNAFSGGAAIAEDATTVFFNPAGMARIKGTQFLGAGHIIKPQADFSDINSRTAAGASLNGDPVGGAVMENSDIALVPNIYAVWDLNKDAKIGLGINAPFGLGNKYDDTWKGRYHAVESDLRTININPSFAFNATEDLSVGFGINFVIATVTLSNAIDFGSAVPTPPPQSLDGFVEITGDNYSDFGYGWNLGFIYNINKKTRIGYAYRSFVDLELRGDADFIVPNHPETTALVSSTGFFVDTGVTANTRLPQSASLSLVHDVNNNFRLMADLTWTRWSVFDELRIQFDSGQADGVTTMDWENTNRYSLGVDYRLNNKFKLRAGMAYDETPIQSAERRTPRIPGNDRTWISFGAQYKFTDKLSMDIGYSHLFIGDTPINNELETSIGALNGTLEGDFEASVDILSAQIVWQY